MVNLADCYESFCAVSLPWPWGAMGNIIAGFYLSCISSCTNTILQIRRTDSKAVEVCARLTVLILYITLALSFIEVHITASNEEQYQIGPDECSQDPQISPSIGEVNSKLLEELIADLVCTIRTVGSLIIDQIPWTTRGEKGRHILSTGHAWWRREKIEFRISAVNRQVMKLGAY